jgi:hypothetical protein
MSERRPTSTARPRGLAPATGVASISYPARWVGYYYLLLVLVATVVFVAFAGLLLVPPAGALLQAARVGQPPAATTPAAPAPAAQPAPTALAPDQIETVLSYAGTMRTDDSLVEVRPGVFAKRSNVEGIRLDGRTIYYDLVPDQSFGPLRSGKLSESQVTILAREQRGPALVLIYTPR